MDVSAMVQEMVNSGNYGFGLRQVNEMPYGRMIFASGDHPDTNQRPLLIVNFTPQLTCLNLKLDKEGEDATVDDYNPANNNPNEIEYFCGGWTINGFPVRWRNFSNSIYRKSHRELLYNLQLFPCTSHRTIISLRLTHP